MEIHSTSVGNLKLLNPKFQNPTEVQWDFFYPYFSTFLILQKNKNESCWG